MLERGSDYFGLRNRHKRHVEIMAHVEKTLKDRGKYADYVM